MVIGHGIAQDWKTHQPQTRASGGREREVDAKFLLQNDLVKAFSVPGVKPCNHQPSRDGFLAIVG